MTNQQLPGLKICLISVPVRESEGSHILVLNFLRVLLPIAQEISLITGNYPEDDLPSPKIRLTNVRNDTMTSHPKRALITRASKYVAAQLKMSYHLAKIASEVDVVIFYIGGSGLLLPMLTAKLRRKKTIIVAAASGVEYTRNIYRQSLLGIGGFVAHSIVSVLEGLNHRLCDEIVVSSSNVYHQLHLEKQRHKVSIAHEHFLDLAEFKIQKPLGDRNNLVGYIGRLSQERGILNFVKAISLILSQRSDIELLIGGNGQLFHKVEEELIDFISNGKVKLTGWIPHNELPNYLNALKLLINPSYTDTGPQIAFEAMACGAVVLSTPVGSMPDVIREGENGFIMEDNSPECIARNVIRALNHPNLEEIAENARVLIEREFTYETAVERYRKILSSLPGEH